MRGSIPMRSTVVVGGSQGVRGHVCAFDHRAERRDDFPRGFQGVRAAALLKGIRRFDVTGFLGHSQLMPLFVTEVPNKGLKEKRIVSPQRYVGVELHLHHVSAGGKIPQ